MRALVGNRSKSSCGTHSTHAALHQRQCAPFPSQYSHLREEKELIMLMQDPQSTQHRLGARDTPVRTVDQLSTCQKRRRVKCNLLYFYRRYGPTNAAASQGCRPGLALELASACRPSAVSFESHSGVPDDQAAGQKNDFQPFSLWSQKITCMDRNPSVFSAWAVGLVRPREFVSCWFAARSTSICTMSL